MYTIIHKCSIVIMLPLTALVFQWLSCERDTCKGNYVDFVACVHLISVLHTVAFPLVDCSELSYPSWKGTFTFPPGFHLQVIAILFMEHAHIPLSSVALNVTWRNCIKQYIWYVQLLQLCSCTVVNMGIISVVALLSMYDLISIIVLHEFSVCVLQHTMFRVLVSGKEVGLLYIYIFTKFFKNAIGRWSKMGTVNV